MCFASQLHEFFCVRLDFPFLRIFYCKPHKCKVFRQYGFSYALSDYNYEQTISGLNGICMVFLQYGFSCVVSDYEPEYIVSDITDTYMVSLQYGFSCVSLDDYVE